MKGPPVLQRVAFTPGKTINEKLLELIQGEEWYIIKIRALAKCTITFTDSKIFGVATLTLDPGQEEILIGTADETQTTGYTIKDAAGKPIITTGIQAGGHQIPPITT